MAACIITFFCCCSFFSLHHRFLTTANWKEANEKKIRICARNMANTIDNSIATLVWSKCRVPFVSGANNNNNERRHRLKKKTSKIHTISTILNAIAFYGLCVACTFSLSFPLICDLYHCTTAIWLYGIWTLRKAKAKHTIQSNSIA